jgi:hypothetical protein
MAGAIVVVGPAPVAARIAIGAAVYVLAVVVFKGLTKADIGMIRELARTAPMAPPGAFE